MTHYQPLNVWLARQITHQMFVVIMPSLKVRHVERSEIAECFVNFRHFLTTFSFLNINFSKFPRFWNFYVHKISTFLNFKPLQPCSNCRKALTAPRVNLCVFRLETQFNGSVTAVWWLVSFKDRRCSNECRLPRAIAIIESRKNMSEAHLICQVHDVLCMHNFDMWSNGFPKCVVTIFLNQNAISMHVHDFLR